MDIIVKHEEEDGICVHSFEKIDPIDLELLIQNQHRIEYTGDTVRQIVADIWSCKEEEIPDPKYFIPVLLKLKEDDFFRCTYTEIDNLNTLVIYTNRSIDRMVIANRNKLLSRNND